MADMILRTNRLFTLQIVQLPVRKINFVLYLLCRLFVSLLHKACQDALKCYLYTESYRATSNYIYIQFHLSIHKIGCSPKILCINCILVHIDMLYVTMNQTICITNIIRNIFFFISNCAIYNVKFFCGAIKRSGIKIFFTSAIGMIQFPLCWSCSIHAIIFEAWTF